MNTNFDEFETELLRKPGIGKEYDSLSPNYAVVQELIQRRNELHISRESLITIVLSLRRNRLPLAQALQHPHTYQGRRSYSQFARFLSD